MLRRFIFCAGLIVFSGCNKWSEVCYEGRVYLLLESTLPLNAKAAMAKTDQICQLRPILVVRRLDVGKKNH